MSTDQPKTVPEPISDALVRARALRFAHGPRTIYDGVDIDIPRGKVTAIMGPSGTGKTTLLRLIGGQWRPAAGSVTFDGTDVHRLRRAELYSLRKRMGMLFQNGALLTDLSVFENVAFPLREHTRLPESMIRDLVLMKLQAVGLRGARDLYPEQLSGGMSRRVALARAIALDPAMVMYDEPFTGQDPISMGVLMRLIRSLNDALGLTSIVVSHDVEEVLSIADYAYVIAQGKVQVQGSPAEVREAASPWVQQFLRGEADGPVAFHYRAPPLHEDLLARGERA
ncbi:MAG TPA: ABC transporter ATP-binding protein [Nevskiaceae bacterium]|nr:ABC transporter ATP-binding protein [Nevskiaceae bacterium]